MRKDRKEFLKCQILLSEKNPELLKKINQEKKTEDKSQLFTRLVVDEKFKNTENITIEQLKKKKIKRTTIPNKIE